LTKKIGELGAAIEEDFYALPSKEESSGGAYSPHGQNQRERKSSTALDRSACRRRALAETNSDLKARCGLLQQSFSTSLPMNAPNSKCRRSSPEAAAMSWPRDKVAQ